MEIQDEFHFEICMFNVLMKLLPAGFGLSLRTRILKTSGREAAAGTGPAGTIRVSAGTIRVSAGTIRVSAVTLLVSAGTIKTVRVSAGTILVSAVTILVLAGTELHRVLA